jgi:type IV pilus assembly protein PilB
MAFKRLTEKKLGELLFENGVLTKEQLERALDVWRAKKGTLMSGEVFVELKFATEEDIVMALVKQYRFPHIALENCVVSDELIKLIPEQVAMKYKLLPIDKIGNNLTIAITNPLYAQALQEVKNLSGCEITVFIATASAIEAAIAKFYRKEESGPTAFPEFFRYK